jgi:hypothetical protein
MVTAEEAVRNYLTALHNPELLRDEGRIDELSKKLADADDPLERLQLRSELQRTEMVDTDQLEVDFVTHAKAWATEQGVPPSVFKDEGVPRDVLRKAGLDGGRGRQATRARRPRVSREDVVAAIPPRRKFTTGEIAERSGASLATVRAVITELLAKAELEDLGPAEDHTGPGRAPTMYKRAGK